MSTQGRVHRIATPDDVVVPEPKPRPKPKPTGMGTPVDSATTLVLPPGVRPANSFEAMVAELAKQPPTVL